VPTRPRAATLQGSLPEEGKPDGLIGLAAIERKNGHHGERGRTKYILLRSENIDSVTDIREGKNLGAEAIAGWAFDFGKDRVVFNRNRPYTARYVATRVF
jgi:hypothetical protein